MKEHRFNNPFVDAVNNTPQQIGTPKKTIIYKKKNPVSFERRFLSSYSKSCNGILEVAMVWNDNVMSIKQYKPNNGSNISVGRDNTCSYKVDINNSIENFNLLNCKDNVWSLNFNKSFTGFIIDGDKKVSFKDLNSASIKIANNTRAKFEFGDVNILVHYIEPKQYKVPISKKFDVASYGSLLASILLHGLLFSIILFSTNRVDALMVDRIMTSSRFASTVEEIADEPIEDKDDIETNTDDVELIDTNIVDVGKNSVQPANIGNDNNSTKSADAKQAAMGVGLLSQSNAMSSMLASAMDVNLDISDWSTFDSSLTAASNGYGLATTGTGGGAQSMGSFQAGSVNGIPGGKSSAISSAANNYNGNLGPKNKAAISFTAKKPDVTGSIDKRIIQKIVRQHTGELRSCYERELAKVKNLNGRVTVLWIIDTTGSVAKVGIKESTLNNSNVETCMISFIKSWRFQVPKGGSMASVEYPFVFEVN